jgi:putative tricarboxylic transport membrane protein
MTDATSRRYQTLVAAGVVLLALGIAGGAVSIPSDAGYSGVGPNFLPWVVASALLLCGGFLMFEARTTGFQDLESSDTEDAPPFWAGFVWLSTGMLVNAALITTIGFILSCVLCFVFASRGLRQSQGKLQSGLAPWISDTVVGVCIAAPVYWLFTKFLAINLPGLTQSGWL